MKTEDFFQSRLFKGLVFGVTGFIILAFVFGLGVFVGLKRADFSFRWADEYHRNFGGPQGGLFGDFLGTEKELPNTNGSFGQIIKIDNAADTLTIKDVNNVEKTILLGDKTTIIYQRKNVKLSDLKTDENVIVIGEPNTSGQIGAELIRVMPPKPQAPSQDSPTQNSSSPAAN